MFKIDKNTNIKSRIKYNLKQDFPSEGVLFIDFTPTFSDIKLMNDIASDIAGIIKSTDSISIDCIVTPESRGYILGVLVAAKLGVDMIPVRKHGKLPEEFISDSYTYQTEYSTATLDLPKYDLDGKTCLFIDDVYALGGTYYACKRLVETARGSLNGGVCLYNVGINDSPAIITYLSREDIDEDSIV